LKLVTRWILVSAAIAVFVIGCGYRNPYVYSGPDKSIYVTTWKNRTSNLQLDAKIYQELVKWFQKSGSLKITKQKEGADYILGGEIVSIDIPSLAFDAGNDASDIRLKLKVRYILKDLKDEQVLFQRPDVTRSETYTVTDDSNQTRDNYEEALDTIVEELAQDIYQRTLVEFSKSI